LVTTIPAANDLARSNTSCVCSPSWWPTEWKKYRPACSGTFFDTSPSFNNSRPMTPEAAVLASTNLWPGRMSGMLSFCAANTMS